MKKLFLTGATGFIGGAILAKLLSEKNPYQLLLLVRGSTLDEGVSRLRENIKKFGCTSAQLQHIDVHNIILGDLANPQTFLSDPRLDDLTHVINCAAVASFGDTPLIWEVNVKGTEALAQRLARIPSLVRFLHVGTAMSCVPDVGEVVSESMTLKPAEAHLVDYTYSKSMIEHLLTQHYPTLPLVIVRPSIVVGHSTLGCQPSSSIFWVFRMVYLLRQFLCSLEDSIDVIPVDYCADAILFLLNHPRALEKIYHISAGETRSSRFADIDKTMAEALQQPPLQSGYQQVSYIELVKRRLEFKQLFGPCNERLMLRAIRLYGEFSRLSVRFSNQKLLSLGMPPPPAFQDYIALCITSTANKSIPELMRVDLK